MAKPTKKQMVLRILRRARNIIRRRGWTQGAYARDKNNVDVTAKHEAATCFCMEGAIFRACNELTLETGYLFKSRSAIGAVQNELKLKGNPSSLPAFNDRKERTKQEVLDMFGAAIEDVKDGKLFYHG